MARYTIRVPGAVTVVDGGAPPLYSTPPAIVGDPPQWSDDSDATYADLETFEHPDVSYGDGGIGALDVLAEAITEPADLSTVTVTAHVRFESRRTGMKEPRVFVYRDGVGNLMHNTTSAASPAFTPMWTALPLVESRADGLSQLLSSVDNGDLSLRVYAPFLRVLSYEVCRTFVFEAYLVIDTGTFTAPPCRLFPREDDLGVGGGRIYPPPRSQQRSGRRFGYY